MDVGRGWLEVRDWSAVYRSTVGSEVGVVLVKKKNTRETIHGMWWRRCAGCGAGGAQNVVKAVRGMWWRWCMGCGGGGARDVVEAVHGM